MASIENQIFDALKTTLDTLTWPVTIEFERIRQKLGDFREHELPAIQFYDASQSLTQLQGRMSTVWTVIIEIIMKQTTADVVDQGLLLDRIDEVHRKLGENPQLGLTSLPLSEGTMISILPFSYATDLHMETPFYTANLTYNISYEKPYSSIC